MRWHGWRISLVGTHPSKILFESSRMPSTPSSEPRAPLPTIEVVSIRCSRSFASWSAHFCFEYFRTDSDRFVDAEAPRKLILEMESTSLSPMSCATHPLSPRTPPGRTQYSLLCLWHTIPRPGEGLAGVETSTERLPLSRHRWNVRHSGSNSHDKVEIDRRIKVQLTRN